MKDKTKKQSTSPSKKTTTHTHKRMSFQDVLMLSTRTFRTRPLRTTLTILGMSVGIGAVLFLVSLGYGLQETVLNRITTADALLSLDVSPGDSELIQLNNVSIAQIESLPSVADVSPVTALPSQIAYGELTGVVTMYGIEPSFFGLSGLNPTYGSFFTQEDIDNTNHTIVVSSALAALFDVSPEEMIGHDVSLTAFLPFVNDAGFEEVKTVDINDMYTISAVIDDESESFIYAPTALLRELTFNSYIGVKVKATDPESMPALRDQIIEMGFFVSVLQDTIDQVKKIFTVIQVVLGLFGLIALIVSAIGMFNTMTVMLLERTNEIGIMRSIGVTKRDVKKLFMIEAMVMGFMGGLGGVVLGQLGGFLANLGINILAKNFGGQALDLFSHPPSFIIIIIAFSTIIGFLTGVFPARRAGKLKPLDALRYK
ncbi:MAG: hypothetical protein CO030_00995 [Candidatus Magasanikbacteria bacterium CG_4_9_14_0_2_um_filter_42_11]|uniref:ABC transporter permease n=1 Tax=Candidatus Magasanikbacteria bacterium CG_4_9_14_0_2_um_filter_42_11 TaxID=1974643 RepID=A0A2M8FAN3_9BACT|nr:MAG: hypothetical protein COU34_00025 [Candidatus Magasanikbacteria bacterium CG10_big_fil_rev_8_21_14_0_10_43_9]PIY92738.1 MAG: hypothetical protein COY70_01680 [Candidatus Magasanikbacteria bacterium CG_4_10_14_0_8_um_filter_42_12]PJC52792.1 MAG: hypothetical protein CO030_00995 [Candidatus Magasanikbacteria bacterium CG_4_9_14_0_2_um_filter_42_11]